MMARNPPFFRKLRYGGEAAVFFLTMGFFRLLGVDGASSLGGALGRHVLYRTSLSNRARENLGVAYPEKSESEIDDVVREMWDNLGRTIAEYAHLDKFNFQGPDARIELANLDTAARIIEAGKGILFVSGHFGNWEIMPIAATEYGLKGALVYRPLNNPYVDRWMVRQRGKKGPKEHLGKGAQGIKRIFTLLRNAKSIFLLVDQKTSEGVPAPFFGRIAMTTPAPAALALKLGAVILPVTNERLSGARFRMTVHEPIICEPSGHHDRDVLTVTTKINDVIERAVRYRPSQWLWIHRRWPSEGDQPRKRRGRQVQALLGEAVRVESDGSSFI
ncbi:MAG: lysophospholipid acyltransferase family protein [Alphaproteobacteria bacterium]|nr:lysophospholipid acyltransferase family protein [Alphaproteobacteria bacterium]